MNIFALQLFENPGFFFIVIFSVAFSVCVHEFMHAYTALRCGDSTAADAGHLTLNPLKQMGIFSMIMLLLLGFCWGAVPVNPHVLTRKKRILISLAGPLSNLGLFVLGAMISTLLAIADLGEVFFVTLMFTQLNMLLFCINILPVPGFDGGNVVAELLPMQKIYQSELGKGVVIGMILLFFYCMDSITAFTHNITHAVIAHLLELFHG